MTTSAVIRIVIIALCLYNCTKSDNAKILKINPNDAKNEIKLSEIIDSIKYIKLQTDSSCIIGRAHTIIIKDKYIYVLDVSQKIIFVFNKTGNFVAKLDKMGKGPGEYTHLGPMFIDENEKYVEVIAISGKGKKLLKYSNISFNLITESSMPDISANSCRRVGDMYYFATQQIENVIHGKTTNANLIVIRNNNVENLLFRKNIETNYSSFCPNIESFTINDKGELFVSVMYENTFYKLVDGVAYPEFTIDFGRVGIDNTIGKKSITEQMNYIKNTLGLASFPVLNLNNSNIMAFSYYVKKEKSDNLFYKSDFYQYLKLKNGNKVLHTRRIVNDITSFPEDINLSTYYYGISHEVWYKDYLVDIVLPNQYFFRTGKNEEDKIIVAGLGQITEGDNPIIVLMKLKKPQNE